MNTYERLSTTSEIQHFYDQYGALRLATLLHTYGVSFPPETISRLLDQHKGLPMKGIGSKSMRNGWDRYRQEHPKASSSELCPEPLRSLIFKGVYENTGKTRYHS